MIPLPPVSDEPLQIQIGDVIVSQTNYASVLVDNRTIADLRHHGLAGLSVIDPAVHEVTARHDP